MTVARGESPGRPSNGASTDALDQAHRPGQGQSSVLTGDPAESWAQHRSSPAPSPESERTFRCDYVEGVTDVGAGWSQRGA